MLVFTPLTPDDLAGWASGTARDLTGYAATPGFLEAFELTSPDSEDADLTLLEVAGLAGLLQYGVRIVAVCEADADAIEPPEFGAVAASKVAWRQVESLFTDDEPGRDRAEAVASQLGETALEDAWESEAVQDLMRTTELLWHDVTEWDSLQA